MNRPPSHLAIGIAASAIAAAFAIESIAGEGPTPGPARVTIPGPDGASRKGPTLDIDPEDRAILLKSLAAGVRDAESVADPLQRFPALVTLACGQYLVDEAAAARTNLEKAKAALPAMPGDLDRTISLLLMGIQLAECGDRADARTAIAPAVALMGSLDTRDRLNVTRTLARAQTTIGEEVGAGAALKWAVDALVTMTSEGRWQVGVIMTLEAILELADFGRALDIVDAIPEEAAEFKAWQLQKVVAKLPGAAADRRGAALTRAIGIASALPPGIFRARSLASVAVAQAESGDIGGALATTAALGDAINNPDVNEFRPMALVAIASAQARAGDREKSRASFEEATRFARAIPRGNSDLRARRLRAIAAAQARAGLVPPAFATAVLIEDDDYHRSLALSEIGNAQLAARDSPGAFASFRRAFSMARQIKARPNVEGSHPVDNQQEAFSEAARGMARAGDFDQAVESIALARSLDPKQRSNRAQLAHVQIVVDRASTGDIQGALKASSRIEEMWTRFNALELIAAAQGERGAVTDACAWIAGYDDPQLRLRLMSSFVKGLVKRSSEPRADLPDLSKLKKMGIAK